MLYLRFTPSLPDNELLARLHHAHAVLDQYSDGLPAETMVYLRELRRHVVARSAHYSTRIEGNTLDQSQVENLLRGDVVVAPADQRQEIINYHEAMQFVQKQVVTPGSAVTEETIRTIHFIGSKSLPGDYDPGRYRTGQNYLRDRVSGVAVYRPPPPDHVAALMAEFVEWLHTGTRGLDAYYVAALAHLNLVAIHPFNDGNGRTARILESLVLYQAGFQSQELVSLEEYFGLNTQEYYRALAEALGRRYEPDAHDVRPWTAFYLEAHVEQAGAAVLAHEVAIAQYRALVDAFGDVIGLDVGAVWMACGAGMITSSLYREAFEVGSQTASRHLNLLVEAGLLTRHGQTRNTHYRPTERVMNVFLSA